MKTLLALLAVSAIALADERAGSLGFSVESGALVVSSIDPGGLAERGGLRVGDRIEAVEGEPATSVTELLELIPKFATEVRLTVTRDDDRQDLLLPLAAPPKLPPDRRPPPDDRTLPPTPPADRGAPPPPKPPDDRRPPADDRGAPPPPKVRPRANVLPFLITPNGFAAGETSWFLDALSKIPVAQAAASADGSAVAWVDAQGKLVVWRNGKTSELPMPGPVTLLGWMSAREVALASGTRDRAEVNAVDAESLALRPLFSGDLAAELLPAPACVSGYLPAAGVFARVVVNKPIGTVSFYRPDGKRHGTLQPFDGSIVSCAFGPNCVYAVKGSAGNPAGEVFPAVPGLPKQPSMGVTIPENAGFAFSPDGRYWVATVRAEKRASLAITDGPANATRVVFERCDRGVLGWQGAILLGSGEGLFRLRLVPRNAENLAIEAREKEAADDRDGAEAVWGELVSKFPSSPEARDAQAWLDARQRERDDQHAIALVGEAEMLARVERFEEAIALYEQVRRDLPRHPAAADGLRRVAELQERIEERERRKRDELIALLMSQAAASASSGKWAEAIQQYGAIRQQFPGLPCDAEAARKTAEVERRVHDAKVAAAVKHVKETEAAGKWEQAIEEHKAIRASFPGEPCDQDAAKAILAIETRLAEAKQAETERQQKALLDEGQENEKAGRAEEAVKVYEGVRQRWPGSEASMEAVRRIGAIEAKLKETAAAEFAKRVAERMETARKLADQGDLERALQEAQAVLAIDPENGDARVLLSAVEKAIAEREEGARRSAAEVVKQVATAKALLEGGDLDGAEKAYREALAADAGNMEAQVGAARVSAERKKREVATLIALAKKRLDLGQVDAAREEYRKALAIDPGNLEALVGLVEVEEAAKRPKAPAQGAPRTGTPGPEGAGQAGSPSPTFADFQGPVGARLGAAASIVRGQLGRPDFVTARPAARADDWTYAAAGLVVVVSRETFCVVDVRALGAADQVAESLRGRFAAFAGKTDKGIGIGDTAAAVVEAYGQLTRERDGVEMSFRIEGDCVTGMRVRSISSH